MWVSVCMCKHVCSMYMCVQSHQHSFKNIPDKAKYGAAMYCSNNTHNAEKEVMLGV